MEIDSGYAVIGVIVVIAVAALKTVYNVYLESCTLKTLEDPTGKKVGTLETDGTVAKTTLASTTAGVTAQTTKFEQQQKDLDDKLAVARSRDTALRNKLNEITATTPNLTTEQLIEELEKNGFHVEDW